MNHTIVTKAGLRNHGQGVRGSVLMSRRHGKSQRLTVGLAHRQAMLAAAMVAAEVRDEAEEGVGRAGRFGLCGSAWYQAADTIAKRLLDLADRPPAPTAVLTGEGRR